MYNVAVHLFDIVNFLMKVLLNKKQTYLHLNVYKSQEMNLLLNIATIWK